MYCTRAPAKCACRFREGEARDATAEAEIARQAPVEMVRDAEMTTQGHAAMPLGAEQTTAPGAPDAADGVRQVRGVP